MEAAAAVPGLHSAAAAACVCAPGRTHWLRVVPTRRRWTGRTQRLVCLSGTRNADSESQHVEERVAQSRRFIVQTGAALALLAALRPTAVLADVADPAEEEEEESTVKKSAVGLESWNRVRGDGFALSVPPNYDDIVEYDDSGKSLYGERAKEKTFLARFASPDRKEVLSVVARNSTQLKLSFLQTQDITAFGSLEEAAKLFVPAGSKIVAAATRKPADARVPRTYYLYEFLARDDKRVVMSAAAAGGRVFVFGAMAPNSRWKEVGSKMRSAALNFALR